jgi:hypothetical protein
MRLIVFLRRFLREAIPEADRQLAPALANSAFGVYGLIIGLFGIIYALP